MILEIPGVCSFDLLDSLPTIDFMNTTFRYYNCQIISYSGALGARLSIDALNVRRLVGDNLSLIIQLSSTLVTGVVIAMIADWKLALITMCVIPLVGLESYAHVKFLNGFSQDAKVIN